MAKKKPATKIDVEQSAARGIGGYERKRIEKRIKNGKIETAGRIVDPVSKKVYSMYKGPKGKKYKLTEELGAVQRRGVKLGQQKKLTTRLLGVKRKKKKKKT
jgi:hypothetical protein